MSATTQMREDRAQRDKTLVFILDLRDPFSYLALGPAIDLAFSASLSSVDWLPIRKHTLRPPSTPRPEDDRGVQHRRSRAQMIAREIAIYAEAQKIKLESPYRDGHADAAYRAWLWIRASAPDRLPAFLKAVFQAYWAEGLDPEKEDGTLSLLERLGFDRTEFEQWASRQGDAALRSLESQLEDTGISQAPACLVEDEVFYGRQHLPMVRWILDGRKGNGPI